MIINITLSWPPSVNHYWWHNRGRTHISREGVLYRADVCARVGLAAGFTHGERLSVTIAATPPDRRRRDLDNVLKCLLDSLQHAGVYGDDSQIDALEIHRWRVEAPGRVLAMVEEMHGGLS